jgi:hypothetical protein
MSSTTENMGSITDAAPSNPGLEISRPSALFHELPQEEQTKMLENMETSFGIIAARTMVDSDTKSLTEHRMITGSVSDIYREPGNASTLEVTQWMEKNGTNVRNEIVKTPQGKIIRTTVTDPKTGKESISFQVLEMRQGKLVQGYGMMSDPTMFNNEKTVDAATNRARSRYDSGMGSGITYMTSNNNVDTFVQGFNNIISPPQERQLN